MVVRRRSRTWLGWCVLAIVLGGGQALGAQDPSPPSSTPREALGDAWWTGALLAPSAGTLPPGHWLIEPYLYDIAVPHSNTFGSRSYIIYGLAHRFSVGVIPVFGFNDISDGPSSSGIGVGDFTVFGQYRLTQFQPGSWVPTMSVNVQETLPTGRYDDLGSRPANGFGAGAFTTEVSLYTQTYFWLPNGRILRTRFNVSQTFSTGVNVNGVSVYGTTAGFSGRANPGNSSTFDLAGEYSLTRHWVLALDVVFERSANTWVAGSAPPAPDTTGATTTVRLNSGASAAFAFAPAFEYNWRANWGVILGTRLIPRGLNTPSSIAPVVAINIVQ